MDDTNTPSGEAQQPTKAQALLAAQQAYYALATAENAQEGEELLTTKREAYEKAKNVAGQLGVTVEQIEQPVDMDFYNANRWRITSVTNTTRPLIDDVLQPRSETPGAAETPERTEKDQFQEEANGLVVEGETLERELGQIPELATLLTREDEYAEYYKQKKRSDELRLRITAINQRLERLKQWGARVDDALLQKSAQEKLQEEADALALERRQILDRTGGLPFEKRSAQKEEFNGLVLINQRLRELQTLGARVETLEGESTDETWSVTDTRPPKPLPAVSAMKVDEIKQMEKDRVKNWLASRGIYD